MVSASAGGSVRRIPQRGVEHQLRGRHAAAERQLGVPPLDGERFVVAQLVVVADPVHGLFGKFEADAPTFDLLGEAKTTHLFDQPELLIGRSRVDRGLDRGVGQRAVVADDGPLDGDIGGCTVPVEPDGPEDRRPGLALEQAGGPLAQLGRMERDAAVGAVDRGAAAPRLEVDGVPGLDPVRHVGDRVVEDISASVAFEVEGLVEVAAPLGVDGQEREVLAVAMVPIRVRRARRSLPGERQRLGGKLLLDAEVGANPREARRQLGGEVVAWHGHGAEP